MTALNRRAFLEVAAAGGTGLLGAAASSGQDRKPYSNAVGVQLYTVRNILPRKPLETLKAIEAMGYREAEVTQDNLQLIWPALMQTSLKPVSIHLEPAMLLGPSESEFGKVIADAKQRGFRYVVFPWLDPSQRGGVDVYHKLAKKLNDAGKKCQTAGLQFCYHHHAFEFQPMDSTTPLDVILGETDESLVGIEMDTFWVSVAGHDPVEVLGRLSGRVHLIHLKDKAKGIPVQFNENVPNSTFQPVGAGSLNFQAILDAAAKAGVKHYIVEQDECAGNPLDALRQSYGTLQKLHFTESA